LDAKIIAAEEELKNLEKEAQDLSAKKEELSNSKSFFNRAKTEEEVEQLNKQIAEINKKKTEWLPFIKNKNKSNQQKEQLMRTYEETRLKRAVVTKEYRFINQYFGSIKEMNEQIQQFLADYLSPKKGELDK
jgi:septal ring factor EnvC (AmiA/AmiB activator)